MPVDMAHLMWELLQPIVSDLVPFSSLSHSVFWSHMDTLQKNLARKLLIRCWEVRLN